MTSQQREDRYFQRTTMQWLRMTCRQRKKALARQRQIDKRGRKRTKGDHRNWIRKGKWMAMPESLRTYVSAASILVGFMAFIGRGKAKAA